MLRWVHEYIEENNDKWEEIHLVRSMEEYEKKVAEEENDLVEAQEDYEKKEKVKSSEVINSKKRKLQDDEPEEIIQEIIKIKTNTEITRKENWKDRRQETKIKEITKITEIQENKPKEDNVEDDLMLKTKIKVKLKQPKLEDAVTRKT